MLNKKEPRKILRAQVGHQYRGVLGGECCTVEARHFSEILEQCSYPHLGVQNPHSSDLWINNYFRKWLLWGWRDSWDVESSHHFAEYHSCIHSNHEGGYQLPETLVPEDLMHSDLHEHLHMSSHKLSQAYSHMKKKSFKIIQKVERVLSVWVSDSETFLLGQHFTTALGSQTERNI